MIFRILNHLNLVQEESPGTLGRSPPEEAALARSAEIVCEPFCDDLEPDEAKVTGPYYSAGHLPGGPCTDPGRMSVYL